MKSEIKIAQEIIWSAEAICITAGAGMGVDSGLPDFRGNEGFWRAYPAVAHLGYSFSQMANPKWFESDPYLAWAFYGHRLNLYRNTTPHDGFRMLQELVASKAEYFIFTSNVDGQFQKSGFSEEKIYECHGSIHYMQCTRCQAPIWSAEGIEVEIDMEAFRAINLPTCPSCKAVARPNILMFGDWGWDLSRSNQQARRYEQFKAKVYENSYKLVIIEIGAGEYIPTVRHESEHLAQKLNGFVIRINPRDYYINARLGVGIDMGGLDGLSKILGY